MWQLRDEVIIDGRRYRLARGGPWREAAVQPLAPKITIGEYSRASSQYLSEYVVGDLRGGIGVYDLEEGRHQDRYWWGTLETFFYRRISLGLGARDGCLLPEEVQLLVRGADGFVYATGSVYVRRFAPSNPESSYYFSTSQGRWLPDVDGAPKADEFTLPASAVSALVFNGRLYIACGNGFAVHDPAVEAWSISNLPVVHFAFLAGDEFEPMNRRLFAVLLDGRIVASTTGGTAAADWADFAVLPSGLVVNRVLAGPWVDGTPRLIFFTDRGIFVLDLDERKVYPTPVSFQDSPSAGLGACWWDGTILFSKGLAVWQVAAQTVVTTWGLDRDYGLPPEAQGVIVELLPQSQAVVAAVSAAYGRSGLYRSSGRGWHPLFVAEAEGVLPADVAGTPAVQIAGSDSVVTVTITETVSLVALSTTTRLSGSTRGVWVEDQIRLGVGEQPQAAGSLFADVRAASGGIKGLLWVDGRPGRLFFGHGRRVRFLEYVDSIMPYEWQGFTPYYAPEGELVTGWFDAGLSEVKKAAVAVRLGVRDASPERTVLVEYQVDDGMPAVPPPDAAAEYTGPVGPYRLAYAVSSLYHHVDGTLMESPARVPVVLEGVGPLGDGWRVRLVWNPVPGAVGYRVYRQGSTVPGLGPGLIGEVYGRTGFNDTGLVPTPVFPPRPEQVWFPLGIIKAPGRHTLYFRPDKGSVFFNNIRIRLTMSRGRDPSVSPVVLYLALRFTRVFDPLWSYDLALDLSGRYPSPDGYSPAEQRDHLKSLWGRVFMADIDGVPRPMTLLRLVFTSESGPDGPLGAVLGLIEAG
jgi:hypothetical protein